MTFTSDFTIKDSGLPDETPDDAPLARIRDLPHDETVFRLPSHYCDSDALSDFASSKFAGIVGGLSLVQAICDFVHDRIRFDYGAANPRRAASEALREGVGVCRDFAHSRLRYGPP